MILDGLDVISVREVKRTRKPHECFTCNKVQPSGVAMRKAVFKYSDRLETAYSCSNRKDCKK